MALKLRTVLWIALLAGCGGRSTPLPTDAQTADTTGQATFTCTPRPASARGCTAPTAFGTSAGQPGVTYPVGCRVIFPFDHPYYPGSAASCTCEESPLGSAPTWVCPL